MVTNKKVSRCSAAEWCKKNYYEPIAGCLPVHYPPSIIAQVFTFLAWTGFLRAPKTCERFWQRAFPTIKKMSAQTGNLAA